MNKKINVLVFPCGSEIGLEIHSALKYSSHITLFGASSVPDHGKFVYKNYIDNVPYVSNLNFITVINKIIRNHKIDFIFPAHDDVLLKLSENYANLECKLLTSPLKTCQITRSKLKTYQYFEKTIVTPKIYKSIYDVKYFPVFLKPEAAQGSQGTQLINNFVDLKHEIYKNPKLLILEYLPGAEYTIDCFTDRFRKLKFVSGRQRNRIKNGISVNATLVNNPLFDNIAQNINKKLEFQGAWFFQLKENISGQLTLLEIAPRIAGTMGYHRNLGVNLPLLTIFDALNYDVFINIHKHSLELDRALFNRYKTNLKYRHIYVDLDDCLIIDNQINILLISFLYQALRQNTTIHLLTKHQLDLNKTLSKFRIQNLFDEIIHIKKTENKSAYIRHNNSILIDDSFSERNEVHKITKIPCFDPNEIESLIDWKI